MTIDVKAALLSYRENPSLTDDDRAHIDRWTIVASDRMWQKIVDEFDDAGELPPMIDGTFGFLISRALLFRRIAEKAKYETTEMLRQHARREEERIRALLSLASAIEYVIDQWPRLSMHPPDPDSSSRYDPKTQQALEWLEQETQWIRRLATPHNLNPRFGMVPVVVSRQDGGRGKRARSRAIGVFMKKMVNEMHNWCGKPRYAFVAALTNVAFDGADLGAEEVRQSCRPRRQTGTLKR
jgi:hypothetical protein